VSEKFDTGHIARFATFVCSRHKSRKTYLVGAGDNTSA